MNATAVSDAMLAIADDFGGAKNVRQLFEKFGATIRISGNFHYALGRFRPRVPRDEGIITVSYPEAWQRHYHSSGYLKIDPTIDAIAVRNAPYAWKHLSNLDPQRQQLLDDVRDAGIVAGFTVPIHLADGSTFLASFATEDAGAAHRFQPFLSLVSAQFLERHAALTATPEPAIRLTPRERDCMTWTARGKSAWEIGVLLNISENTVNFHIKNACAKLESNGRMLGVVKAIMRGLISP